MKQRKGLTGFDEPTVIPGDPWIEVRYFDVPGGYAGSVRMNLSDLIEWLGDNPGYVIHKMENIS